MEIRPSTSVPPGADLPDTQGTSGLEGAAKPVRGIDLIALSQTLGYVQTPGAATPEAGAGSTSRAVLPPPSKSLTPDEMIALLQSLQTKSQEQQLSNAKESLETNRIEQQNNNDQQMKKIDEWIDKSNEANKSGIWGKIMGWVSSVAAVLAASLMVVAAVAVTAVTGGLAGPVMIALAAMAVVGAVTMLASQVSTSLGGPEISINNIVTMAVSSLLKGFGMDEEKADEISKVVAGAVMLATGAILIEPGALGAMAGGIAAMAGADADTVAYVTMAVGLAATITVGVAMAAVSFGAGAAAAASSAVGNISAQTARTVTNLTRGAAEVAKGVAAVAQGGTQVARGAEGIQTAGAQKAADDALADKKELEALLFKLQKNMDDDREALQKVMAAMDKGVQMVNQMINGMISSMSQVTGNIGTRAMV